MEAWSRRRHWIRWFCPMFALALVLRPWWSGGAENCSVLSRLSPASQVCSRGLLPRQPRQNRCRARSSMHRCMGEASEVEVVSETPLEREEVSLGKGKADVVLFFRGLSEEDQTDVQAVQNGEMQVEELYQKHSGKLFGEGVAVCVWPSALFLAQFLSHCSSFIQDKRVLELGSGVGLAGLSAAVHGAESVLITDKEAAAVELVERNAQANGVQDLVRWQVLDWTKESTFPDEKFDVIIGADILLFQGFHGELAKFLARHLAEGGRALISDPRQRYMRPHFQQQCELVDLEVGELFASPDQVLLNVLASDVR
eukprot:TRINITY_DN7518_c0_g2_i1.p1 TRINITY_DN7518_c0_g2~~TRINITY_DN7518_c0_g2_i1.p1  ORF type:complete len:312 (-),score=55.53 TRINITY_DN7518_c0_g2_i1:129-1064(-)